MPRSIAGLLVGLCLAEILTMLGIAAFAALLPDFSVRWGLSSTQAGWIGSAYFVGYTLAVPVLVSLTDRIDPARIFIASVLVTAVANLGFAVAADGFWSAAVLRALAGAGLAGTYMPGAAALAERVSPERQSRIIAFYTSCYMIGNAVSFPFTSWTAASGDYATPFYLAAAACLLAAVIAIAASAAFVTPVSTPVVTLVVAPGGYRFMDFVKVGTPLLLLAWLTTLLVTPLFFPFLEPRNGKRGRC